MNITILNKPKHNTFIEDKLFQSSITFLDSSQDEVWKKKEEKTNIEKCDKVECFMMKDSKKSTFDFTDLPNLVKFNLEGFDCDIIHYLHYLSSLDCISEDEKMLSFEVKDQQYFYEQNDKKKLIESFFIHSKSQKPGFMISPRETIVFYKYLINNPIFSKDDPTKLIDCDSVYLLGKPLSDEYAKTIDDERFKIVSSGHVRAKRFCITKMIKNKKDNKKIDMQIIESVDVGGWLPKISSSSFISTTVKECLEKIQTRLKWFQNYKSKNN